MEEVEEEEKLMSKEEEIRQIAGKEALQPSGELMDSMLGYLLKEVFPKMEERVELFTS